MPPGNVFISYRREDTRHIAGRLFDRLTDRLGTGRVFMDVDSIEPGLDFAEAIQRAVSRCEILLALIGRTWLSAEDPRGRRRLADPDDWVRLEVSAALARNIRVIPVLVDGATVPGRDDLPEPLAALSRRNAIRLDHETFRSDVVSLLDAVERAMAAPDAVRPPASGEPVPAGDPRPGGRGYTMGVHTLPHPDSVNSLAFDRTGTRLATGCADRVARIWDMTSRTTAAHLARENRVSGVCFDPRGSRLVVAGSPTVVWEPSTGAARRLTTASVRRVVMGDSAARFSPDGTRICTVGDKIRIWDATSGNQLRHFGRLLPIGDPLTAIAYRTDGALLATDDGYEHVDIWGAATGRKLRRIRSGLVGSVVFSPEGDDLLVASYGGGVKLWNSATGREEAHVLAGRTIVAAAFHPSGRYVALACMEDRIVGIWDLRQGREHARVAQDSHVMAVAFSQDGRHLVTGERTAARIWPMTLTAD